MNAQQIGLSHPLVKHLLRLRHDQAPDRFVADGLWAHEIILDAGTPVDVLLCCPETIHSPEARRLADRLAERAERAYRISARTLERISERDRPDGLVSIARLPAWDAGRLALGESALVLVADGIENPGNLGTLIRTLDACAADCLLLTNRRTRPSNPKVFRASHGMSLKIPVFDFDEPFDAVNWLQQRSFTVYLADADAATSYKAGSYAGRTAFVVGNERYGISEAWRRPGHQPIRIPMLGTADSLNAAISASILLYEARAAKDGW